MPVATLPYKRPFFQVTLAPHEIEEDLAIIITNTKRKRRTSPPAAPALLGGPQLKDCRHLSKWTDLHTLCFWMSAADLFWQDKSALALNFGCQMLVQLL
ncbi:hypothetical protein WJX84_006491 [Apatococcus fuscideae]|uniref:Uncharacterized protein n=1 Tax=Apatococcus fuscideae TaxID=2026836 RepID=A0AAW1T088_9CHLO